MANHAVAWQVVAHASHHHPPHMNEPLRKTKRPTSLGRFVAALRNSFAGYRHAITHESAFREELLACAVLAPVSVMLPVSWIEHLILLVSLILIVLVELINSAIEATVDRISLEHHPLAGQAKDLASAAVLTALLITGLCWAMIVGPVVVRWW